MKPDEIVAHAREQGVQLVRFLYCDNGGVIRGKSTHIDQLSRRMKSGIGLVTGMQSFTSLDSLAPDASYVNFTDPDLEDWRGAYYGPNAARLAEVKRRYDPDRFFEFPQAL